MPAGRASRFTDNLSYQPRPLTNEVTMFAALLAAVCSAQPSIECIDPDKTAGSSLAAVVDEAPLVHTGQLLPAPKERGDAGKQLDGLLDRLERDLASVKSGLDRVVKLNVYAASPNGLAAVRKTLAKRFSGKHRPAVCVSVGAQPQANALVSLDAVAVAGTAPAAVERSVTKSGTTLCVLPAGPVYYVSGQAERGLTLQRATQRTLQSLRTTLSHYRREDADVVQLRAFVNPMSKAAEVRKELEAFYGKDKVPPLVLVEWTEKDSIEIELIASAPKAKQKAAEALEFLTPPQMTSSPVFSRMTRINHGRRIYVSGLHGEGKDAEAKVKEFFVRLRAALKKAGGDEKHLAKATYFVAGAEASKQLNTQRLTVYDPRRPPAASKAMVATTGREGGGVLGDFIGVPVK
jgi:enamine deaminase RidA (YjgF/YER057c/UK114 family)